ncbi:hypothetical protein DICA3_D10528 [Diutina catenulata]
MIRRLVDANVYVIKHTLLIPLKLLFVITVYIPFIKLPVLTPAKYMLELDNDWYADKSASWFSGQVELFIVNIVHFVMVNVFLGVIVGLLTGFNLKAIRYVLTWKPRKSHKKKTPKWARHSRQFVAELSNHVVTEDVPSRVPSIKDLGLSQLPATKATVSTSAENYPSTNTMRQRSAPQSPSSTNAMLYEDDDGYSAYVATSDLSSSSVGSSPLSSPSGEYLPSQATAAKPRSLSTSPTRRSSLHNILEEEDEATDTPASARTPLSSDTPATSVPASAHVKASN